MPPQLTPLYSLFGMAPEGVTPARYHVERVSDRREVHRGQVEPHRHPHLHQLTYWIAGEGEYQLETARYAVAPGSLCWVPAGHVHGFSVGAKADAIVLSMARDHVSSDLAAIAQGAGDAVLRHPCVMPARDEADNELAHLFRWAQREHARADWGAQDVLSALARHAFVVVGRFLRKMARIENAPAAGYDLFRRLEASVEGRFRDHPAVDALAAELGSTPYLLNQASRAATGLKVSDYVRSRVMHEAQRLLLFTAVGVAEVAALTGYSDPSHFTRAFRAFHGETPSVWRDRHMRGP
jgi:AraC family transcriptional activator of pobA